MARLIVSLVLSILAITALTPAAWAGWAWCRADPVVTIGGTVVDIYVAIPPEYLPAAAAAPGRIRYEVRTPKGVERQLVLADLGYNLQGSDIAFTDGGGIVSGELIPTRVEVRVPLDESALAPGEVVPVELTVIPANGAPVAVLGTAERTVLDLTVQGTPLLVSSPLLS